MRSIINISLPPHLSNIVTKAVKTGDYTSKSEFFRDLLRMWMENNLYKELEQSRKELKTTKGKLLTSLKDLR